MLTIKETVANNISEIQANAKAAPVWEDSESEAESSDCADSRFFFIEMFSGTGGLGRGVETYDVHVHYFDIKNRRESVPQNLLGPKCQEHINNLLNDPNCMGIWFALPCGTFSSARRNDGKGPKPLRCKKHVTGLPTLTGHDKKRSAAQMNLHKL